ncbi:hypothetical protein G4Y79_15285 [Phototrophicus methaneseepsis]|uniref:Uncharacterized protein n=1 Tax=Phototrophicus methaneseepsis TaxID=2710758 RepID=A0A7S8E645_9CHLR|nr:hypothetical protein [Phototrophicus methaneseepsis]QPC81066.1 hypothetical protein G4Y79_15285 [Phototrophicus methaneseepsis]
MTFTYDPSNPDDVTRVRWHLSDTAEPAMVSDEEISFATSEAGSWQKAVIFIIDKKLMDMSMEPDFQADWLRVDAADAKKRLETMRTRKLKEFGLSSDSTYGNAFTTTHHHTYRADSLQTEEPDYDS